MFGVGYGEVRGGVGGRRWGSEIGSSGSGSVGSKSLIRFRARSSIFEHS